MIVELVHSGFDIDFVLDLPILDLHRYFEVSTKVRFRDALREANVLHAATQGTTKAFRKTTKSYKEIANKKLPLVEGEDDSERILKGRKQAGF